MNQPLLSDEMLDTLQREMSVNNPTSVAAARGPSDAGGETISVIPQPTQNLHWMRVTDEHSLHASEDSSLLVTILLKHKSS